MYEGCPSDAESSETVFPSEIILSSSSVTHAGPVSELAAALSPVRELDISRNLVSQWSEVYVVIACLSLSAEH
jgi:hypothetical protein